MNDRDAMNEFTSMLKAGKFEEAGAKFWHENLVSVEAAGPAPSTKGRATVMAKAKEWYASNELHSTKVEGPFPNGNQFAIRFEFDITPKGQPRRQMTEIGLYTLNDGKIVEERFFYAVP